MADMVKKILYTPKGFILSFSQHCYVWEVACQFNFLHDHVEGAWMEKRAGSRNTGWTEGWREEVRGEEKKWWRGVGEQVLLWWVS